MDAACACAGTGRERKAEGRASSGLCIVPHAHSTLSLDSRVSSPPRAPRWYLWYLYLLYFTLGLPVIVGAPEKNACAYVRECLLFR